MINVFTCEEPPLSYPLFIGLRVLKNEKM